MTTKREKALASAVQLAAGWIDANREDETTGEGQQARWILDTMRAALRVRKEPRLGWLGVDQNGTRYQIEGNHPRKWLLDHLGRKSAQVMYQDRKSGPPAHTGWIIAGLWIDVYQVFPLEA